jgi:perosamine synthetase
MDEEVPRRTISIAQPATGDEEWQALREPLARGWLTQGEKVAAFEKAFAERHGVRHARACTSGTTALHLVLAAAGIGPGDEVIVPAFTWVATANAVVYCGGRPVFADIDPVTFNVDPRDVERKRSGRTRAVIAVHLFGLCADMDALAGAVPGIGLLEDAACAAGASYKGRCAGSMGGAAAFSFHPRKAITTGEGGMVTTDDDRLARQVTILRNHGAALSGDKPEAGGGANLLPEFEALGYNYRMTDLQGALGLVQLRKLDAFIAERRRWATFYERELGGVSWLRTPMVPRNYGHVWQSYVVYVDPGRAPLGRNEMMRALQAKGIATRPGTQAVHGLGFYRRTFGTSPDDCPCARDCEAQTLAIPLHNRMSAEDYEYVAEAVRALG